MGGFRGTGPRAILGWMGGYVGDGSDGADRTVTALAPPKPEQSARPRRDQCRQRVHMGDARRDRRRFGFLVAKDAWARSLRGAVQIHRSV